MMLGTKVNRSPGASQTFDVQTCTGDNVGVGGEDSWAINYSDRGSRKLVLRLCLILLSVGYGDVPRKRTRLRRNRILHRSQSTPAQAVGKRRVVSKESDGPHQSDLTFPLSCFMVSRRSGGDGDALKSSPFQPVMGACTCFCAKHNPSQCHGEQG